MTSAPEPEARKTVSEADAAGEAPDAPEAMTDNGEEQAVEHDLDRLLEETKRERDSYLDLARRAKADFENYRKRAARDAADAERRGKATLARDLLPAIDNLERALHAAGIEPGTQPAAGADEDPSEEASGGEALARGVALVLGELQATLERSGVEAYDPVGERFDPSWHEALQTRPAEDTEAGVVVETLERGYRLDGQVLRAARVVVSE